jgi:hypothetical protein
MGLLARNNFDQRTLSDRMKKMETAKPLLPFCGQMLCQQGDRNR